MVGRRNLDLREAARGAIEAQNNSRTLMIVRRVVGFSFLFCSTTLLFAASEEWPQWRGPNRDGSSRESGLLKQWPAGGPPLAWTARKLGPGYSSVSVAGGKIFTAGETTDSSFVYAIDLNGQLLWSAKLGKPGERGGFVGPRGTPTVDGAFVYTLGQFGDLVCHQAADGKEVWRKNLPKDFGGKVGGWGYSESVIVDGNNVVCTPGGSNTMLALNKNTGDTVWRTADWKDGAEYVSATIATIGGVKQYVQMTQRSLAGISTDGKVLWRADRKGSTAVIPTPVVKDDLVYVTSGYGVGCNGFKITKSGATFTAEQIYTNKAMVNHHGGVILLGDHVYGHSDSRGWTCQNVKTGEAAWSSRKLGKGALAYADGHFYLRQEDGKGTVVLIEATPEAYKEVGRFDQPDRSTKNSWPHAVITGGKLYLRDQDTLLCYDVKQK
jgi:outer membrane protein assembly factor BamB